MEHRSVAESMDQIIYVGVGVFILILILDMAFQGYAQSNAQFQTAYNTARVSNTLLSTSSNAINYAATAGNSITLACTGSCSWISAVNALTVSITGNSISALATNTVFAIPGNIETQTFTVAALSAGSNTLTSTTGNFYNISNIVLGGIAPGAYPSFNVVITQTFNSVVHNSAPTAYLTNTISGSAMGTATQTFPGTAANFSIYAGPLPNTFGGALQLAVFALVFIAIILAIVGALRGGGAVGVSGGFLG